MGPSDDHWTWFWKMKPYLTMGLQVTSSVPDSQDARAVWGMDWLGEKSRAAQLRCLLMWHIKHSCFIIYTGRKVVSHLAALPPCCGFTRDGFSLWQIQKKLFSQDFCFPSESMNSMEFFFTCLICEHTLHFSRAENGESTFFFSTRFYSERWNLLGSNFKHWT
jgi:hypothetical protein